MKTRGLDGVKRAISDAHIGLKKTIATVFQSVEPSRKLCRQFTGDFIG
ncbi:transposase-like protein [Arthrobacter psychrochitiniphilus]|nr:transposase-like protein [Arthrobacter psychrochitiniphilus]